MSDVFGRIRGHVYPRYRGAEIHRRLNGSDIILGMLCVMLIVLMTAYVITLVIH